MAGLYLYCFTPGGHCAGLDLARSLARPVSCVEAAGFSVWAEATESSPPISEESIRRHDAVVRAVWEAAPACLPVRHGQWLPDPGALADRLDARRAELEEALARVAGAGEHVVRIADPEQSDVARADEPRPRTGRLYMEWLRARARRREEHGRRGESLARELEAATAGVVRAQRVDILPERQGLVSVSHLVPRDRRAEYGAIVEAVRTAHPELLIVTAGPWPPYSFAP